MFYIVITLKKRIQAISNRPQKLGDDTFNDIYFIVATFKSNNLNEPYYTVSELNYVPAWNACDVRFQRRIREKTTENRRPVD